MRGYENVSSMLRWYGVFWRRAREPCDTLGKGVLQERSGQHPVSRDANRAAGVTLLGHVDGIATQAFFTHGAVTEFVTWFTRELKRFAKGSNLLQNAPCQHAAAF